MPFKLLNLGRTFLCMVPNDAHFRALSSGTNNSTPSYRKDDRAMRPMYGRAENFPESLTTPTATFPELLMGFCSD